MTIVAIGAHPDDPEEGAGGTLARFNAPRGNPSTRERLIVVYVTSGGAGIAGTSAAEACKIRESEAREACKILNAEPVFLGLPDGSAFPTQDIVKKIEDLLEREEPRVVLTNWPLDTHPDHRCAWFLAVTAFGRLFGNYFPSTTKNPFDSVISGKDGNENEVIPSLFFWETAPGHQSLCFQPDMIVGIDEFIDLKMEALQAHASQNRGDRLVSGAEQVAIFRARNAGGQYRYVEGFMRARPPIL